MDSEMQVKQQVREFYNQIGWREQSDGFYQNASYEDLRPVSQEYIHKCHLRVLRHLNPQGRFLLDAGSGPIQYPEYLEYSKGYQRRVCADISRVALQEARKRIGDHGLFVVCDIAHLPFKSECFDGEVSLHTLHHLPLEEHRHAYQELHRTLAVNGRAVVVNGWYRPPLSVILNFWINLYERLYAVLRPQASQSIVEGNENLNPKGITRRGTYVRKESAAWLQKEVGSLMPLQIWCWRSVSVRFLRAFIHERLGGKFILRVLYWKEELFPHFLGKYGQYPLVEFTKIKVKD
jgi:ubiquinone/menaquinone biosynthesis C-methylase UbiE